MKVVYDKASDLFLVNGKQVFWSSVYVLRQKKADFKTLCRRLKVSKEEVPLFQEELDDLRGLGFIRGKNKITTTKKGREFLRELEHKISFKHLREKGIEDIDDVFTEAKRVYALTPKKTKLMVKSMPRHQEKVAWFSLFFNTAAGYFVFFLLGLLVFFGMGNIDLNGFFMQLVFAPIAAVMIASAATVVLYMFYHSGRIATGFLFRSK